MDNNQVPDFRRYFEEWAHDLEMLRQNKLLGERELITFARERGIAVSGAATGDPGNLHRQDRLASDGLDYRGPLFHPFRMYPLHCILDKGEDTRESNQVADLAILLEPVYWPRIIDYLSCPPIDIIESDVVLRPDQYLLAFQLRRDQYRQKALQLVGTLDANLWRKIHESLRLNAARLDGNGKLYLLLRLANWRERESLKGRIALALWMRHIAEVIRRAFEEVHAERWPEEDQAFLEWNPGSRTRRFGAERPLDDARQSGPYLAWEYGLFTGSSVRWYVEGDTEYYAILHMLPEPPKIGIELINLRGVFRADRDNIALKLGDWLREDKAFRRFSMISFDRDIEANVKTIRRQVKRKNVVGYIAAHEPDFEFANFTIQELAEVAARLDEAKGFSGDAVRNGNWAGIVNGRAFEERYKEISARQPRGLKGKEWGEALAAYMDEHPNRPDDGSERPFTRQILAALQGRLAHYDLQKEYIRFDPNTFEQINLRRVTGASPSADETGAVP
jgi:hypothetical protein